MCMTRIYKKLKRGKSQIGWKVVRYKGRTKSGQPIYGPLMVNKHHEFIPGNWYDANYKQATFISEKSGNPVCSDGIYGKLIAKIKFTGKRLKGVIPVIRSSRDGYYECGFHFFISKADVKKYLTEYPDPNEKVVECEFKGIISEGFQWYANVGVARKQKILKVLKKTTVKSKEWQDKPV